MPQSDVVVADWLTDLRLTILTEKYPTTIAIKDIIEMMALLPGPPLPSQRKVQLTAGKMGLHRPGWTPKEYQPMTHIKTLYEQRAEGDRRYRKELRRFLGTCGKMFMSSGAGNRFCGKCPPSW